MVPGDSPEERLAGCLRFPTVSARGGFSLEPFLEMHEYSRRCWSGVFSRLGVETLGGASLLLEWPGSDDGLEPVMLTAHQDVVPAAIEDGWEHPPFQGVLRDGRIHGRGAIDYKCGYAGILEALETLCRQGFRPRRTILCALGHDEEIGGAGGAGAITGHLAERGIMCDFALDEGGYIHTLPWSGESAALIGVAEKGYATFSVKAFAVQGHASVPTSETAAGVLAAAITIVEANPFPLNPPGRSFPFSMPRRAAKSPPPLSGLPSCAPRQR